MPGAVAVDGSPEVLSVRRVQQVPGPEGVLRAAEWHRKGVLGRGIPSDLHPIRTNDLSQVDLTICCDADGALVLAGCPNVDDHAGSVGVVLEAVLPCRGPGHRL